MQQEKPVLIKWKQRALFSQLPKTKKQKNKKTKKGG